MLVVFFVIQQDFLMGQYHYDSPNCARRATRKQHFDVGNLSFRITRYETSTSSPFELLFTLRSNQITQDIGGEKNRDVPKQQIY